MEGVSSCAGSIYSDESAEFEIIQQAGQDNDDENDYAGPPADLFHIHSVTTTATPLSSTLSSSCGAQSSAVGVAATSAVDVSEAFGVGKSMSASSVSAYQSQSLLDSMYSIPPFANNPHMEKLVILLHEEQNKNRVVLERIMQTVTDLSKERDDNTELRTQNQALKAALQQEREKSAELATSLKAKNSMLAEARQTFASCDAKANQMLAERDSALADARQTLDETRRALANRDEALAVAYRAIAHCDSELASLTEIVNILQEERREMVRQLDANRAAYRRNLDALEAQMAGVHERGEFPDGKGGKYRNQPKYNY